MKIALIVLVVVVLILGVGWGYYAWKKKKQSQEDTLLDVPKDALEKTFTEGEEVNLPKTSTIYSAVYGTQDTNNDVTVVVQQLVKNGPFRVTNENMGGDPVVGTQKKLTIQYK